jgi:hypothetical protein
VSVLTYPALIDLARIYFFPVTSYRIFVKSY